VRAIQLGAAGIGVLVLAGGAARADSNYWYTIPVAASQNSIDGVRTLLLERGNNPDGIDSSTGRTALDYAVSFDNLQMATLLLDHGAHVDALDQSGGTALHWAAELGKVDMIKFLLDHKASVDATNRQGITPLMLAASHARPAAIKILLAHGADPKKQDYTGRDAIAWAGGKPAVMQALNAGR